MAPGLLDAVKLLFSELEARVRKVVREELASHHARDASPKLADERFLSAAEAAKIAGVASATVRAWVSAGRLPRCSAGRLLRIRWSDLDRFLSGQPQRTAARRDDQRQRRRALARLGVG